jgi:papain like protease
MSQVQFGRRVREDAGDRNFPMRLRLDPLKEQFFPKGIPPGYRHYSPGPVLDQGSTGTCVAHGWTGRANAAPVMQAVPWSPFDFYRRIVLEDEFSDNDSEATASDDGLQLGTTVRAGAKVLQRLGLLTNYLWAERASDVRAWHLAGFGGCVIGIDWYGDMMTPDSDGFLKLSGGIEGGHCVESVGWNDAVKVGKRTVPALRVQNSWGRAWGEAGRAWIAMTDLEALLGLGGEACAPVEVKVARAT